MLPKTADNARMRDTSEKIDGAPERFDAMVSSNTRTMREPAYARCLSNPPAHPDRREASSTRAHVRLVKG